MPPEPQVLHFVLIKVKGTEFTPQVTASIEEKLERIPGVVSATVRPNRLRKHDGLDRGKGHTHALTVVFSGEDVLDISEKYESHPLHVAVRDILKTHLAEPPLVVDLVQALPPVTRSRL